MLVLPNISRSKGNQTMKFDRLIESNMKKYFLKKSYAKCGGETNSGHFSEKSKPSISLDQKSEVLYTLLLLNSKLGAIEIY